MINKHRATTQAEWEQQMAEYVAKRDAAMADVNVEVGDTVEYHNVSMLTGNVQVLEGTVYLTKRGAPRVRVGRESYAWHKGWRAAGA